MCPPTDDASVIKKKAFEMQGMFNEYGPFLNEHRRQSDNFGISKTKLRGLKIKAMNFLTDVFESAVIAANVSVPTGSRSQHPSTYRVWPLTTPAVPESLNVRLFLQREVCDDQENNSSMESVNVMSRDLQHFCARRK